MSILKQIVREIIAESAKKVGNSYVTDHGLTVEFSKAGSGTYATIYLTAIPDAPLMRLNKEPIVSIRDVVEWADKFGKKFNLSSIKSQDDWNNLDKSIKDKIYYANTSAQTLYKSTKGADKGYYDIDKY